MKVKVSADMVVWLKLISQPCSEFDLTVWYLGSVYNFTNCPYFILCLSFASSITNGEF